MLISSCLLITFICFLYNHLMTINNVYNFSFFMFTLQSITNNLFEYNTVLILCIVSILFFSFFLWIPGNFKTMIITKLTNVFHHLLHPLFQVFLILLIYNLLIISPICFYLISLTIMYHSYFFLCITFVYSDSFVWQYLFLFSHSTSTNEYVIMKCIVYLAIVIKQICYFSFNDDE